MGYILIYECIYLKDNIQYHCHYVLLFPKAVTSKLEFMGQIQKDFKCSKKAVL